jgi:prevent-host-death family protein
MSMKTMTASAASKEFGLYIDTAQHEPVLITKQGRPVAVTMSAQLFQHIFEGCLEAGIEQGLKDIADGRFTQMSPDHREAIRNRFRSSEN